MKRIFLIYLIFQFSGCLYSQVENIDSLENILNTNDLSVTDRLILYEKVSDYYVDRDAEKSLAYGYQGLELAEKAKDKALIAGISTHIGRALCFKASFDSSFLYLNKAIVVAEEIKDRKMEARAINNMGHLHILRKDYDKALEAYLKCFTIYENIGDKRGCIRLLLHINSLYDELRQYDRGMHYLEKAQTYLETIDIPQYEAVIYQLMGAHYLREKDYEKALENMLKAFELSSQYNLIRYEVITTQYLAGIYSDGFQDYKKAEEYAMKCVEVAEKTHSKDMSVTAWNILTKIYIDAKKFKEAKEISLKLWENDSTGVVGPMNTANHLAICYLHLNDKEKALYYFNKRDILQRERAEKELLNSISDVEIKYETEKKEIRISTLEKEKQLYSWLIIAGGVALLMSLGLLFYRHRVNAQKRKIAEQEAEIARQKITQLEKEKQLIATQSVLDGETAERSRLARDLHDGLGGMLSVVKLNMEKELNFSNTNGQNPEQYSNAMKMLDKSIMELRRIAHHLMPESLMYYGLKVSLEDFCRAIPNAHFQYIGKECRLEPPLEIMLYRCAHELINNAVKYANAAHINVQLVIEKSMIALTIDDDGVGFDPEHIVSGTGLENIRARILAYNGKITIRSVLNEGTEIIIEIESV